MVLVQRCRRADGKLERAERPVARAAAAAAAAAESESTPTPLALDAQEQHRTPAASAGRVSRDFIWAVRQTSSGPSEHNGR